MKMLGTLSCHQGFGYYLLQIWTGADNTWPFFNLWRRK